MVTKTLIEGKFKNKRIFTSFGKNNINLQIVGPDRQWVYVAKSIIEDRLKRFKELALRNEYVFFGVLIIQAIFIFFLLSRFPVNTFLWISKEGGGREISGLGIITFFFSIIIALIIAVKIAGLYPNITFLIGKEVERHEKRLKLRSHLFWGVIIASVISVLGAFIIKFLPF